jgi:regulator of protease activity HflC (stomatin/prohibitin superfamily)
METALSLIPGLVIALFVAFTVLRAVRIVPQARARHVERLGRYDRTLQPGLNFVIPYFDRVYPMIDLRAGCGPADTRDGLFADARWPAGRGLVQCA